MIMDENNLSSILTPKNSKQTHVYSRTKNNRKALSGHWKWKSSLYATNNNRKPYCRKLPKQGESY